MKDHIEIREISGGEAEEACNLVITSFSEFIAPGYSSEGVIEFGKFADPAEMRKRIAKGGFVLAAVDKGRFVGIIEVRFSYHVSLLFVEKKYHRKGIARMLLNEVVCRCRSKNPLADFIEVNSSPYAVSVYEKLGFRASGREQIVNGVKFTPMKMDLV